jgi:hypothetical protein
LKKEIVMLLRRVKAVLAVLGFLLLVAVNRADDPKTDDPASQDKQMVNSKAVPKRAAASVNFKKELGLSYPSLGTLGARIDAARRAPDPVTLAHAASKLDVAEQFSGHKASLTSPEVLAEAAELASLRKQEAELKAVLQVSNQVLVAEERVASLKKQIALAQAQTKRDQQAFQMNQEPSTTPIQVVVNNHTTQSVEILVNGYDRVLVAPKASQVLTVEHPSSPTVPSVLYAFGTEDDMSTWGPRNIWGQFTKYKWNIE